MERQVNLLVLRSILRWCNSSRGVPFNLQYQHVKDACPEQFGSYTAAAASSGAGKHISARRAAPAFCCAKVFLYLCAERTALLTLQSFRQNCQLQVMLCICLVPNSRRQEQELFNCRERMQLPRWTERFWSAPCKPLAPVTSQKRHCNELPYASAAIQHQIQ